MPLHLVQYQPEIPQNTGNIIRTCAATGVKLHLIKPLGFSLEDKQIKRSGVNYINEVDYATYENWETFIEQNPKAHFYFYNPQASKNYTDLNFTDSEVELFIILGSETRLLPKTILSAYSNNCFKIPMTDKISSLNLSNAAALLIYEGLRQQNFLDLWKDNL